MQLEMIFPPSFFDSMEHLPIHLSFDVKVGGPVQYRWMYLFERYLFNLKKKVKNKVHVEASICKAYIVEEISTFISYYFEPHLRTRINRVPRHDMVVKCLQVGTCQYFPILDDPHLKIP